MISNPLRYIEAEMVSAIQEDRPIHSVLVESHLWEGFLLQLDLPGDLKKLKILDGQEIVKNHMDRLRKTVWFDDECPFAFRKNDFIQGCRVMLYQKRNNVE